MNRNPIIPFVVIMIFGIGLMFLLSFKGLGDAEELAKEKEGGGKTEEVAANPEDIYKQSCVGCHGADYSGGVGPALKGVGKRLSQDEIKTVVTKGRNSMPPGLVPEDKAADMAKWLAEIK
ncbi:cytochrome c550 [Neobacillus sp. LXY-4]|uniref:cytochrome c550 n=1 Tax=Neobacillus sp. LXY-4 TaxID=3379826 RepID=UPI003EE07BB0